jgi:hypothetical protein
MALLGIVLMLTIGDALHERMPQKKAPKPDDLWWELLGHAFGAESVGNQSYAWAHRASLLIGTVVSVVIIGVAAGPVTTWLATRIERMRRGRCPVRESGRTLFACWSAAVPQLLRVIRRRATARRWS